MSDSIEVTSSQDDASENEYKAICEVMQNFEYNIIERIEKLKPIYFFEKMNIPSYSPKEKDGTLRKELIVVNHRMDFLKAKLKVIIDTIRDGINSVEEMEEFNSLLSQIEEQQDIVEQKIDEFKEEEIVKRDFEVIDDELKVNRKKLNELKKYKEVKTIFLNNIIKQKKMVKDLRYVIENMEDMPEFPGRRHEAFTHRPMNQPLNQPFNLALNQPMNLPLHQPLNLPFHQPLNQSLNLPLSQPLSLPLNAPVNPSLNQPLNQGTEEIRQINPNQPPLQ